MCKMAQSEHHIKIKNDKILRKIGGRRKQMEKRRCFHFIAVHDVCCRRRRCRGSAKILRQLIICCEQRTNS